MADSRRTDATPTPIGPTSPLAVRNAFRVGTAWHRSCTVDAHSRASAETEDVMRVLVLIATVAVVGVASPLLAQERPNSDPRGFITGFGGTTRALGNSTGNVQVEGGVRIAPHLMVFGNLGRFQDLHGDLQPTLDAAVASLSADQGLDGTSTGTIPAWYGSTGLRASIPMRGPVSPYVLGGFGFARLNPKAEFM